MPKFTLAQDLGLKSSLELTMGKPTVELPVVEFAKSKKAKRKLYVPNGKNLYERAVNEMCSKGFPLELEVHSSEQLLFTEKFWEPLGVKCTVKLGSDGKRTASLDQSDPQGKIPVYVAAERQRQSLAKAAKNRSLEAVKKIHDLTREYTSQVDALLVEAGVYQFKTPGIQFIDFSRRPYRCFPSAMPNLRSEHNIVTETFTTGVDFHPYLWEMK